MAGPPYHPSPLSDSDFDLSEGLGEELDNVALGAIIAAEIGKQGPITFRRFMELALYHPTEGYYTSARQRIGRAGDYVTSPEISPLFGYALGRQLADFWRCLGSPSDFSVVECGAGSGRLAGDLLRWVGERDQDCYQALTYTLIDASPTLRSQQLEALSELIETGKVRVSSDRELRDPAQCIIANELLDSFPVHRVTVQNGVLREVCTGVQGHEFVDVVGELSTPALQAYFSRLGLLPAEDSVVEVNLDAGVWLSKAANCLSDGYLLLLDYGYQARRLYAPWRRTGTLLCYHRHTVSEDPYQFVGRQDITSHVDFTSLVLDAIARGLSVDGYTDQSRFLAGLGITNTLEPKRTAHGMQDYYARRRAVAALIDPSGLGRIGVLLLGKNAPAYRQLGFVEQLPAPA